VDNQDVYMYCPAMTPQNDAAEQFAVFPAISNSLSAGMLLAPGTSIFVKSLQTGKFCRVVPVGETQQILCDVDSTSSASKMSFTGTGFSFQGQGFANYGSRQPLQLAGVSGQGVQAGLAASECTAHVLPM
jgi:hypothetical protein